MEKRNHLNEHGFFIFPQDERTYKLEKWLPLYSEVPYWLELTLTQNTGEYNLLLS